MTVQKAYHGEAGREEGETVLDFTTFEEEYEGEATCGLSMVLESRGVYLIADFPTKGEFKGERFVVSCSPYFSEIAKSWKNLTCRELGSLGEVA